MSVAQRSALMSRIRGRDTKPERQVAEILRAMGIEPELHPRSLPGRPDFAVPERRIAIFVDGDFWHGWRFPVWRHKLAPFWEAKIAGNRARDTRNFRRLRRMGWTVVRVWEHQLKRSVDDVAIRLAQVLAESAPGRG